VLGGKWIKSKDLDLAVRPLPENTEGVFHEVVAPQSDQVTVLSGKTCDRITGIPVVRHFPKNSDHPSAYGLHYQDLALESGDSGGGIFTMCGKLVSVASGTLMGSATGSICAPVHIFFSAIQSPHTGIRLRPRSDTIFRILEEETVDYLAGQISQLGGNTAEWSILSMGASRVLVHRTKYAVMDELGYHQSLQDQLLIEAAEEAEERLQQDGYLSEDEDLFSTDAMYQERQWQEDELWDRHLEIIQRMDVPPRQAELAKFKAVRQTAQPELPEEEDLFADLHSYKPDLESPAVTQVSGALCPPSFETKVEIIDGLYSKVVARAPVLGNMLRVMTHKAVCAHAESCHPQKLSGKSVRKFVRSVPENSTLLGKLHGGSSPGTGRRAYAVCQLLKDVYTPALVEEVEAMYFPATGDHVITDLAGGDKTALSRSLGHLFNKKDEAHSSFVRTPKIGRKALERSVKHNGFKAVEPLATICSHFSVPNTPQGLASLSKETAVEFLKAVYQSVRNTLSVYTPTHLTKSVGYPLCTKATNYAALAQNKDLTHQLALVVSFRAMVYLLVKDLPPLESLVGILHDPILAFIKREPHPQRKKFARIVQGVGAPHVLLAKFLLPGLFTPYHLKLPASRGHQVRFALIRPYLKQVSNNMCAAVSRIHNAHVAAGGTQPRSAFDHTASSDVKSFEASIGEEHEIALCEILFGSSEFMLNASRCGLYTYKASYAVKEQGLFLLVQRKTEGGMCSGRPATSILDGAFRYAMDQQASIDLGKPFYSVTVGDDCATVIGDVPLAEYGAALEKQGLSIRDLEAGTSSAFTLCSTVVRPDRLEALNLAKVLCTIHDTPTFLSNSFVNHLDRYKGNDPQVVYTIVMTYVVLFPESRKEMLSILKNLGGMEDVIAGVIDYHAITFEDELVASPDPVPEVDLDEEFRCLFGELEPSAPSTLIDVPEVEASDLVWESETPTQPTTTGTAGKCE
jgi:hypothetical protein